MQICFDALIILTLATGTTRAGDRVQSTDGRIVIEDSAGHRTAITDTGLDSDPWLSPDGRTVVFIRQSPDDMFRTAVYAIALPSRTIRLLYAGPARYEGRESVYFGRPELNDSGDTLFLLSKEHATEGALIAIDLASSQVRLISDDVVGYDVVACPAYRGDLILLKRALDILRHPYHLYWLYSPSGDELQLAGPEGLDLERLLDMDCALEPPPSAEAASRSLLASKETHVDSSTLQRQLTRYVEPTYPDRARLEGIQGDVRLAVRVGADGSIQDVQFLSGPPSLAAAAVEAVRQWRYGPIMSAGHPAPVVTVVTVPFRLPTPPKQPGSRSRGAGG